MGISQQLMSTTTGGVKQPVFMTPKMHGVMLKLRTDLGKKIRIITEEKTELITDIDPS